jgi:hypothetical protein
MLIEKACIRKKDKVKKLKAFKVGRNKHKVAVVLRGQVGRVVRFFDSELLTQNGLL